MIQNSVSFIIVNYNTGKVLKECVESVFKFENPEVFEIIIFDNNSDDDSKDIINEISNKYQNVKSIFSTEKISFSGGNNMGIDASEGEFVLIMNPDIIFTESLLSELIKDLDSEDKLGAVSPMLSGTDGKFQNRYFQKFPGLLQFIFFYSVFAKLFQNSKMLIKKYLHVLSEEFKNRIEFVDQIPCAFFFTKRNILEESGMMDSRYTLFFEDVDLCYQIKKNYRIAVDTSLKVTHLGGASFKTSDDYWLYGRFIISMITFFGKNYSGIKTNLLRHFAVINSKLILISGKLNFLNSDKDDYRLRKHRYFLEEIKKLNSNK